MGSGASQAERPKRLRHVVVQQHDELQDTVEDVLILMMKMVYSEVR